jgi:hypothetical protein
VVSQLDVGWYSSSRISYIIFEKEPTNFAHTRLTPVSIPSDLLREARLLGGHRNNRAAASAACEWYIRHLKQLQILDLTGTIEIDPDYDYKALRRRETRELDEG